MHSSTVEEHELGSRTGQHCTCCGAFACVERTVALVASDTLRVLTHVTTSTCSLCGAEDIWRST